MADLMDVFNSGAGFIEKLNGIIDQKKKAVADQKLEQQKVDLTIWQAKTLDEISKSTNYEDYDKIYDEKWKELQSQYQAKGNSLSYQSRYQAQLGTQIFNEMRAQAQVKIVNMKSVAIDRENLSTSDNIINTIFTNYTPSQQSLDEIVFKIDEQRSGNLITPDQYKEKVSNYTTQTYINMYKNETAQYIKDHPDATNEEVINALTAKDLELDNKRGVVFDRKAAKTQGIQNAVKAQDLIRQNTNDRIHGENNEILKKFDVDIAAVSKDDSGKVDVKAYNDVLQKTKDTCLRQINAIAAVQNQNIKESDRDARRIEMEGLLNKVNNLLGLDATGAKKAQNDVITMQEDASKWQKAIQEGTGIKTMLDAGLTGYEVQDVYQERIRQRELDMRADWEAQADKKKDVYERSYAGFYKGISDAVIDEIEKHTGLTGEQTQTLKDASAFYKAACDKAGAEAKMDVFNKWLMDTFLSTDLTQYKGQQLTDYINKRVQDFINVNAMEFMDAFNKTGLFKKEKDIYEISEKDLLDAVKLTANEEYLYTEGKSIQAKNAAGADAQNIIKALTTGNVSKALSLDLMINTGIKDSSKITRTLETTDDGSDLNARLNYEINGTGNKEIDNHTLRYVSDGKNLILESKPSNETWGEAKKNNDIKTINRKEYKPKKYTKEEKQQAELETKKAQEKAWGEYKKAEAEAWHEDGQTAAVEMINAAVPEGMQQEQWDTMDNAQKVDYFKPDSIQQADWDKMNFDEKIEKLVLSGAVKDYRAKNRESWQKAEDITRRYYPNNISKQ